MFGVDPLFGTIVEQGWSGGPGTAGGMAAVFNELGWTDGASLSITSATVGLIFGVIGGIILINVGVRKGWTSYLDASTGLKNDNVEIYINRSEREVDTRRVIHPTVIDTMAFHAALLSVVVLLGWVMSKALKNYLNFSMAVYYRLGKEGLRSAPSKRMAVRLEEAEARRMMRRRAKQGLPPVDSVLMREIDEILNTPLFPDGVGSEIQPVPEKEKGTGQEPIRNEAPTLETHPAETLPASGNPPARKDTGVIRVASVRNSVREASSLLVASGMVPESAHTRFFETVS